MEVSDGQRQQRRRNAGAVKSEAVEKAAAVGSICLQPCSAVAMGEAADRGGSIDSGSSGSGCGGKWQAAETTTIIVRGDKGGSSNGGGSKSRSGGTAA